MAPVLAFTQSGTGKSSTVRVRTSINDGWRFFRYSGNADSLIYEVRPELTDRNDNKVADSRPTESIAVKAVSGILKPWILPTANAFIADAASHHIRPAGNPGGDFPFVQQNFDDAAWDKVDLPHDWAIDKPFYTEVNAIVGGGMGRLPVQGVGWYRKTIHIAAADAHKQIYLDIDGAMSYAMVWCNGYLVGGWPYGYNGFRLDLTPFLKYGADNQIAIRLDNPTNSARWYPGGGLYRNVWLSKLSKVHVAQWGTFIRTSKVSKASATISFSARIENSGTTDQTAELTTSIYLLNGQLQRSGKAVATFPAAKMELTAQQIRATSSTVVLPTPRLWGPAPLQQQVMYAAVTQVKISGVLQDEYETLFGIRDIQFHPTEGLIVNGEKIRIQGVNQHHDLGALGAAWNTRAAERQLEMLRELGCNAIRLSHNPPAPELLELTDRMGFLVIDEIFDSWERKKTPYDFHLIFPDWYEADTRAFIRRDRNHPSVIAWSYGNEVGEQYTAEEGAALSKRLYDIVKEEDDTRPATASMNYAKPDMPFPTVSDILSLNYQGEGIRDAPAYAHLTGIRTSPLYPAFRQKFPEKMIVSSETASALSTRGTYVFPVTREISAPVSDSTGGDPINQWVSGYELYTAQFGASPDKVFASQDKHPFVAGEFVWSGWDYLGEPTPYYSARSSYCGIIDLAGFKKDRYFLYQARWRPDLPMAHILPHWNWPDRVGQVTPVHVFTSGDEGELFLNGRSVGRKKMEPFTYRLRWDDMVYEPGQLRVVTYKNGKPWANDTVATSGKPASLAMQVDRSVLTHDKDLVFVTVDIMDNAGNRIANADNMVSFSISENAKLVATDNGNPADLTSFASASRRAFSGKVLAIVGRQSGATGNITVTAKADGLPQATATIVLQ